MAAQIPGEKPMAPTTGMKRVATKKAAKRTYVKGYGSAKVSKPSLAGAAKNATAATQTQQHYATKFENWASTQPGGRNSLDANIAKGGPVAQEYAKTGKAIYEKEQAAATRMRAKDAELARVRKLNQTRR
jgi:hypothetical protein